MSSIRHHQTPLKIQTDTDLFESPWLIHMLAKSSNKPRERLVNLFDILEDWLKAPNINKKIDPNSPPNSILVSFCAEQAKAINAENPATLAEHIVLIARNAALQSIKHPESNSLIHAKTAANALITAQTHQTRLFNFARPALYAAASIIVVFTISLAWSLNQASTSHSTIAQTYAAATANTLATPAKTLTAADASKMYAKYEQMRQGTCQFPEALQIPDKHKAVYLENVVGGKLPADLADLEIANYYLEKVRCNFTPMLMAESK